MNKAPTKLLPEVEDGIIPASQEGDNSSMCRVLLEVPQCRVVLHQCRGKGQKSLLVGSLQLWHVLYDGGNGLQVCGQVCQFGV